jgi:hypothetical protein
MISSKDPIRWIDSEKALSEPLFKALKAGRAVRPTPAQINDLSKRLAPLFETGLPTIQADKSATLQAAKTTGTGLGISKGLFVAAVLAIATPVALYTWIKPYREAARQAAPVSLEKPLPESTLPSQVSIRKSPPPNKPEKKPLITGSPVPPTPTFSYRNPDVRVGGSAKSEAIHSKGVREYRVDQEIRLIRNARKQLSPSPRKALRLTEQHRKEFSDGMFVQEREIIAIEALVNIGDIDRAKERADALIRAYPKTAYKRRIEKIFQ